MHAVSKLAKRLFALWYCRRYMPRGLRICCNLNLAFCGLVVLFLMFSLLPFATVQAGNVQAESLLSKLALILPIFGGALIGLLYACDAVVRRKRGARTSLWLSTTSVIFIFAGILTWVASLASLAYSLTGLRRYLFYDENVEAYFASKSRDA